MRTVFSLICFLLSATCVVQGQTGSALYGVNLSGAEFGANVPGNYGQDYSYPGVKSLEYMYRKGVKLVRLPFKWERIQPTLMGKLDPTELRRLEQFLEEARQFNMTVLLDMHNFGRRTINGKKEIIGSASVKPAHVADAWYRLAKALRKKKQIYAYGIMNEPYNMLDSVPWFSIAQEIINAIRTVDTRTPIAVGGDSFSSAPRWRTASDTLKYLRDPSNNLIFEAHVYFDRDVSGTYKKSYDEEGATPLTGVERIRPFLTWLKENNARGLVGEYGVPDDDPRWLVVLDNFMAELKKHRVSGTYWSAGPRWGRYKLAVEPVRDLDRPQMKVLEKYLNNQDER